MLDVNSSMIKRIIAVRCLEEELKAKGILPIREDLNFFDVVSPKILALLGTDEFLSIYEGNDIDKSFEKRGLTKEERLEIEKELKVIYSSYKEFGLSMEIEERLNNNFLKHINKVSKYLYDNNNSFELSLLQNAMKNNFKNSEAVYKSCNAYENTIKIM